MPRRRMCIFTQAFYCWKKQLFIPTLIKKYIENNLFILQEFAEKVKQSNLKIDFQKLPQTLHLKFYRSFMKEIITLLQSLVLEWTREAFI